jgi:hypothetical protein
MFKQGDKVICTDATGGIVGWLTKDMEYVVESIEGSFLKLVGCVYSHKTWRFRLKGIYE